MYRDFQPRNILVKNDKLFYIDYQSGRKGPLQYDVASLLYSGSHNLNEKEKYYLLDKYIKRLRRKIKFDKKEFLNHYYYFVMIRLLQVLGSYGLLYYKTDNIYYIKKIMKAITNLKSILSKIKDNKLKEFIKIIL